MAVDIALDPGDAAAAAYYNAKVVRDDTDFIMLMGLSHDQTDAWVDVNSQADEDTRRILKLMIKALAAFSAQLEN